MARIIEADSATNSVNKANHCAEHGAFVVFRISLEYGALLVSEVLWRRAFHVHKPSVFSENESRAIFSKSFATWRKYWILSRQAEGGLGSLETYKTSRAESQSTLTLTGSRFRSLLL